MRPPAHVFSWPGSLHILSPTRFSVYRRLPDAVCRLGSGGVTPLLAALLWIACVGPVRAQETKLTANDAAAQDNFGVSVALGGGYAVVGASQDDQAGAIDAGAAYVFYDDPATGWSQQARLIASDAAAADNFGAAAALSGDYILIGAPFDDDAGDRSGSVYIIVRSGSTWTEQVKLTAPNAAARDEFGSSVALDDDYGLVGAPLDDVGGTPGTNNEAGSAYVIVRSGASWSQQATLTASDPDPQDWLGRSVALSGAYALVGAPGDDGAAPGAGAAYLFARNGETWTQQAKLTASDADTSDGFGWSVALSGDYALVGSRGRAAYVFARDGETWTQQAELTAPNGLGSAFGRSVALSGDYALVGSPLDNPGGRTRAGSAYLFAREVDPATGQITWTQRPKLTAGDAAAEDEFGRSVAVGGSYALVGAPGDDDGGRGSGSAYLYALGPGMPEDLVVNTTADAPDETPGDGLCDTARAPVVRSGGSEEPDCTLRAAIEEANAREGRDLITFDIPDTGKQRTVPAIRPASPLPEITDPVVIDGATQPEVERVEINGTEAGDADGLHISAGSSTVNALVINNFTRSGIRLSANGSNTITACRIGTDADGTGPAPNALHGVYIDDAPDNIIGETREGTNPENGNSLRYNKGAGVAVTGSAAIGNTIRFNSFLGNQGPAIDLDADGPTANDLGDGLRAAMDRDTGPNNLLNFPVGVTASVDPNDNAMLLLSGVLDTPDPDRVTVDLYSSSAVNATKRGETTFGEGEVHLAALTPNDQGTFVHMMPRANLAYPFLSATATDEQGSTSEFSWVCTDPDGNGTVDNDGDSLCDDWETTGLDYNGDGDLDLDLQTVDPARGADRDTKDLFVEIDYMEDIDHTEEPNEDALKDVIRAFRAAPVDESKGITLHLLKDEALPHRLGVYFQREDSSFSSSSEFNDFKLGNPVSPCGATINDGHFGTDLDRFDANCANILGARRLVFRYAIYGHSFFEDIGSSGVAELPGNDFMVTLGWWDKESVRRGGGFPEDAPDTATVFVDGQRRLVLDEARRRVEAGTLMHELGHTLGLGHGGADDVNCKPNYPSVMSYALQGHAAVPGRALDYAQEALSTLDEARLDENRGLDGPRNRHAVYNQERGVLPDTVIVVRTDQQPIDWDGLDDDGDGNTANDSNVSANINLIADVRFCGIDRDTDGDGDLDASDLVVLHSQNDWAQLIYGFRFSPDFADGARRVTVRVDVPEMTEADVRALAEAVDFDGDGFVNAVDNCPPYANADQTDANDNGVGDVCEQAAADLAVTMRISAEAVRPGQQLSYTMTVFNLGPDPTETVSLTDTLDARLALRSTATTQGACAVAGRVLGCDLGRIARDDSATVTLDVEPIAAGTVTNSASVSSVLFDPVLPNNTATVTTDVLVDVEEAAPGIPEQFRLSRNYPNPFNRKTTLRFDVPVPTRVRLYIYNVLGQQVATLVDETYVPGRYQVTFDAARLPSGLYFCQIEMGDFLDVKTMVLMK